MRLLLRGGRGQRLAGGEAGGVGARAGQLRQQQQQQVREALGRHQGHQGAGGQLPHGVVPRHGQAVHPGGKDGGGGRLGGQGGHGLQRGPGAQAAEDQQDGEQARVQVGEVDGGRRGCAGGGGGGGGGGRGGVALQVGDGGGELLQQKGVEAGEAHKELDACGAASTGVGRGAVRARRPCSGAGVRACVREDGCTAPATARLGTSHLAMFLKPMRRTDSAVKHTVAPLRTSHAGSDRHVTHTCGVTRTVSRRLSLSTLGSPHPARAQESARQGPSLLSPIHRAPACSAPGRRPCPWPAARSPPWPAAR